MGAVYPAQLLVYLRTAGKAAVNAPASGVSIPGQIYASVGTGFQFFLNEDMGKDGVFHSVLHLIFTSPYAVS